MANPPNLAETLASFYSDLNRIQTVAGTLSQIEQQHYNELTRYEDEKLTDIAVAEQSGARQLGEIKQICISMAQKIDEIQHAMGKK